MAARAFTVDPTKRNRRDGTRDLLVGPRARFRASRRYQRRRLPAGGRDRLRLDATAATEAPFVSNFVNSLPLSNVDLEAHSYGTVVTLAALPQVKKTVGHVVLLGGPLR